MKIIVFIKYFIRLKKLSLVNWAMEYEKADKWN